MQNGGNFRHLKAGDCFEAYGTIADNEFRGKNVPIFTADRKNPIIYDAPRTPVEEEVLIKNMFTFMEHKIHSNSLDWFLKQIPNNKLAAILASPNRLVNVSNEPAKHEALIKQTLLHRTSKIRAINSLREGNIQEPTIKLIMNAFEDDAATIIESNPYNLLENKKLDFNEIDTFALSRGVNQNDSRRIAALTLKLIDDQKNSGSAYLPLHEWSKHISKDNTITNDDLNSFIGLMAKNALNVDLKFINSTKYGYILARQSEFDAEQLIANDIIKRLETSPKLNKDQIEQTVNGILEGTRLDEHQIEAVKTAVSHPISIITGGPGTGKSTIMEKVIEATRELTNSKIFIAAPTGKAAIRAEETTGCKASTVSSLLGLHSDPQTGESAYAINEHNQLPENCVVIIDEVSMIDTKLMVALLKAVPDSGRIVLQGDPEQLPSVGIGRVLNDLLDAKKDGKNYVPVSELINVYRQGKESSIPEDANLIINNFVPHQPISVETISPQAEESLDLPNGFFKNIDQHKSILTGFDALEKNGVEFVVTEKDSITFVIKEIVETLIQEFQDEGKNIMQDLCVISPQSTKSGGTKELNAMLSELLNPYGKEIPAIQQYDDGTAQLPRIGDKVLLNANEHKLGVMNGDVGIIQDNPHNPYGITVLFENGKQVDFPAYKWKNLPLAYAITCHKSQGSQYDTVILPFSSDHQNMNNRSLTYTAWTRAKNNVIFVGEPKEFDRAIGTNGSDNRLTLLDELIESRTSELNLTPHGAIYPAPKTAKFDFSTRDFDLSIENLSDEFIEPVFK